MRRISRSSVLPKAVVSSLALALALGACGPEEGDDSAAPDTSESTGGSSGGDSGGSGGSGGDSGGQDLGKDRRNWVPSNVGTEKDEVDFEATIDGKTVKYSIVPDGVDYGDKTADGKTPWLVYASITYKGGDGSILPMVAAGLTLYSDKKTPEKFSSDENIPEVADCYKEIEDLKKAAEWQPNTSTQICVPFVLPESKNPENKSQDGGRPHFYVGYFKPNAKQPRIAAVWVTDDNISPIKKSS